jgi:formiminotetrahydrofolate cyclodeaminase
VSAPTQAQPDRSVTATLDGIAAGHIGGPAGYSAGLAGALAAALVAAAASSQPTDWPEAGGVVAQADTLQRRLSGLANADTDSFHRASKLLGHVGDAIDTGDARASADRDRELANALQDAAAIPLAISEAAADVCTLAAWAADAVAPGMRPDALAAVCLAEAAASAAANLVLANLSIRAGDRLALRAQTAADTAQRTRHEASGTD